MNAEAPVILQIKNLTKSYDKKCILKNINLKMSSMLADKDLNNPTQDSL